MKFSDKENWAPPPLFIDNHLLVVEKPAGILVQPTAECQDSIQMRMQTLLQKSNAKSKGYLTALFRLDKPVSGLLLFARSSKCATRLQGDRKSYFFRKCYRALVEGHFEEKEGLLEDWMVHGHLRAMSASPQKGQHALLVFRVIEEHKETSLVEIELLTGRYHQIRFQLASRGHPIVGDHKYGSQKKFQKNAIALHHQEIIFRHPVDNEIFICNSIAPF